jgi:type IV secretion system protein VirB10
VLGEIGKVDNFGQQRLAVRFHRLIMPDGYSVGLDRFLGMNQMGETGLRDKVDRHFMQVFGVSAAIGALSGLTQYGTRYGLDVSAGDVYRQGVSRSMADSSVRILDRYLNILPTFTIREGHRVKIYIAHDLELPDYNDHQRKEDQE